MKDGYIQGDMKPEVKDCQVPSDAYSEKFNDSTLDYESRNNKQRVKEAKKISSQACKGRYS